MAWDGVELKGETTIPHLTFVQEFLNRYVQYAIVTKQPERLEVYHRMHSFLTEPREIINLEQLHDMIQADPLEKQPNGGSNGIKRTMKATELFP